MDYAVFIAKGANWILNVSLACLLAASWMDAGDAPQLDHPDPWDTKREHVHRLTELDDKSAKVMIISGRSLIERMAPNDTIIHKPDEYPSVGVGHGL